MECLNVLGNLRLRHRLTRLPFGNIQQHRDAMTHLFYGITDQALFLFQGQRALLAQRTADNYTMYAGLYLGFQILTKHRKVQGIQCGKLSRQRWKDAIPVYTHVI